LTTKAQAKIFVISIIAYNCLHPENLEIELEWTFTEGAECAELL